MFVNSNQHISVSNQKLQVCVSYNLNWLLTIFREELDAPGEAFYGLSTASSYSVLYRLIWVVCVTTAMILFVYQVADRTQVYFEFNTTVAVSVQYTDRVPFPAVTVCNINTFRLVVIV